MAKPIELPSVLQRYELKYLVPVHYIEAISEYIKPFCQMDYFSTISDEHFYTVNSLYLDTPSCQFMQQRLWGKDGRFNMRVRAYGDATKGPFYMEIKHKTGAGGKKYRANAQEHEWPRILQDPSYRVDEQEEATEQRNKKLFLRLATAYAIEPKILTQYRRRAFFSTIDEYARLTMDINLRYRLQDHYDLRPNERMVNYDNENIYAPNMINGGECVILELKCNIGEVPMWMLDLIRFFQLKQAGFSKYVNSMTVANIDNGYRYMNGDRVPSNPF